MHACDILAYVYDGAIYCDECRPAGHDSDECSPIFGDHESDVIGATCDTCGSCYVDGNGWTLHGDATDPQVTRWAKCRLCGHQHPIAVGGYDYRRARAESLAGKLYCPSCCGKRGTLHF